MLVTFRRDRISTFLFQLKLKRDKIPFGPSGICPSKGFPADRACSSGLAGGIGPLVFTKL